jgi:hypothetical protein
MTGRKAGAPASKTFYFLIKKVKITNTECFCVKYFAALRQRCLNGGRGQIEGMKRSCPMKNFLKMALVVLAAAIAVPAGVHTAYAQAALTGKVVETMDSAGYTYVQIENNGKRTWVAVPETKVQKGQNISFGPGSEMKNFRSNTLNRTFDSIIFSEGVRTQGGKEKAAGAKGGAAAASEKIKVDKAAGPDAYTVAEIFKNSKQLQEKKVVVRGKVVKVSAAVMNKNWVHIQDGTGAAGSNDLVVTSNDLPKVGDIVTATGTLYNDKDFGGGYRYKVIIEQGSIKN